MSEIVLRVRDLKTGEEGVVRQPSEEAARAWLAARPRFVDVLGLAPTGEHSVEVSNRLKTAVRALDPDELELEADLDAKRDAEVQARLAEKTKQEQASAAAHRAAMASADPNRVMEVHFRYGEELALTDAADTRPITDEAREAVKAWVAERDEWVAGRGQIVGDAKVRVWPGTPLPAAAKGERVQGGSFIPVTAPEKPTN